MTITEDELRALKSGDYRYVPASMAAPHQGSEEQWSWTKIYDAVVDDVAKRLKVMRVAETAIVAGAAAAAGWSKGRRATTATVVATAAPEVAAHVVAPMTVRECLDFIAEHLPDGAVGKMLQAVAAEQRRRDEVEVSALKATIENLEHQLECAAEAAAGEDW